MQPEHTSGQPSIVNLFEKMHSNVTKFKESLSASPSNSTKKLSNQVYSSSACLCVRGQRHRTLQSQLYLSQHELVSKAAVLLQAEGNSTMCKLLVFMSQYLCKLGQEMKRQVLCECKREIISQHEQLVHKIAFLRDENHKFFRMIEQKNQECDFLNKAIERLAEQLKRSKQEDSSPLPITLKSKMSKAESVSEAISSSRSIESSTSRVSQFRVVWPELMMPMNEGPHKGYFEPSPGDRRAHFNEISNCLQERRGNNQQLELGFKRSKIFCGNCLIN